MGGGSPDSQGGPSPNAGSVASGNANVVGKAGSKGIRDCDRGDFTGGRWWGGEEKSISTCGGVRWRAKLCFDKLAERKKVKLFQKKEKNTKEEREKKMNNT